MVQSTWARSCKGVGADLESWRRGGKGVEGRKAACVIVWERLGCSEEVQKAGVARTLRSADLVACNC